MTLSAEELATAGFDRHPLSFVGPGLVVGSPVFHAAFERVRAYAAVLGARLGARTVHATGTVPERTLRDAGYLTNFPQHVLTKAPLLSEIEQPPERYMTSPAACLCVYEAYRGADLARPVLVDFVVTCGRYEAGDWADPFRLAAYQVHEIVAMGTRAEAIGFFDAGHELLEQVATVFPGTRVVVANDAFFGPGAASKRFYQQRVKVKYELQAEVAGRAPVAVASLNSHGQMFGNGFGITREAEAAFSACLGVGLERFTLYALGAFGDDLAAWPDPEELLR